jgi:hypothetical protein
LSAFLAHTGYADREHALLIAVLLTGIMFTGGSLTIKSILLLG